MFLTSRIVPAFWFTQQKVRSAAPKRRALAPAAPSRQDGFATGRSGGMS
jgi:hypothetical protein